MAPQIREAAAEIEASRELPRPLFEAIADAGLFLMAVPREVGGSEIDFPDYVAVIEELGKADASTAWAINQGATFGTFAARMRRDVARAIWIDTPRAVVANTPAPSAKAVMVPGGFRVTGKQGFSTGCRHASWIAPHAQIIENGEVRQRNGAPETRYLLVPKAEVQLHDTWHTKGMRGTGTHTFEINDVFVPEERSFHTTNAPHVSGGPRYKIPYTLGFGAGDGAVALGLARSCLDAFFDIAGAKAPRYMQGMLRDQALSQFAVGQSEAALRSARAFLMEAVHDIWNEAKQTGTVTLQRRASLRLAGTHAIRTSAEIIERIYTACGATSAFDGNLIQRYFQDIHVITQHVQGRLANYEMVGKFHLGLPVDETRL